MGELTDAVMKRQQVKQASRPPKENHPKGWEPGTVWDGSKGVVTVRTASDQSPEFRDILVEWGFDPETHRIEGAINHRRWQGNLGRDPETGEPCVQWFHYWKANIVLVDPQEDIRGAETRELLELALAGPIPKPKKAPKGPAEGEWFFFVVTDTQAGKPDGDGTEGMVGRFKAAVEKAKTQIQVLRASGRHIPNLCIPTLGDLVESCDGHYAQQTFRVELNHRDQRRLVRALLLYALRELAPLFDRVSVVAVAGNHGERRKDGQSFTDFADNEDVALVEDLAWAVQELAPKAFRHVQFHIPEDELDITLDFSGTLVTFAHGHQFRARKVQECEAKAESWWARMAHTRQPAGESTLLLSGHFHHLRVVDFGPKVWIQAPALDGGSDWFQQMGGGVSRAGILTLTVGGGSWGNPEVL